MESFDLENFNFFSSPRSTLKMLPEYIWGFLLSNNAGLLYKMLEGTSQLKTIGEINATSTAAEADEYGVHITEARSEFSMKIVDIIKVRDILSAYSFAEWNDGKV